MMDNRPRQLSSQITPKQHITHPMKISNQNELNVRQIIPISSHQHIDKIQRQIIQIDKINRQLLNFVNKIKFTSPMTSNQTNHLVVDKIQNDIRHTLNQLIHNIMQFFKDIDGKLKSLMFMVQNQFNKRNLSFAETEPVSRLEQSLDAKYQLLSQRIKSLEVSLKQTKINENKLVQVIENMMEKYQVNDQPTLIRETPELQNQFKKNKNLNTTVTNHVKNYSQSQKTKQTANTIPIDFFKGDNKTKSIYEHLYTIDQSIVNEQSIPRQFRLRQIEEDHDQQVFIKKLYSKNPSHSGFSETKKSLKGQPSSQNRFVNKSDKSYASQGTTLDDKEHRLHFMMGKLNL